MANKTTPKKIKMGYELRINRSGEAGEKNWDRAGGTFPSTQAASEYREKKYPNIKKYIILGIRVSAPDKDQPRYMSSSEKPETKKGSNNAPKQS